MKHRFNEGKSSNLYFWRDKSGLEVDGLLEQADTLIPFEIKSAETINPSFYDNLGRFCELAQIPKSSGYIIYGGEEEQKRSTGHAISWKRAASTLSN